MATTFLLQGVCESNEGFNRILQGGNDLAYVDLAYLEIKVR